MENKKLLSWANQEMTAAQSYRLKCLIQRHVGDYTPEVNRFFSNALRDLCGTFMRRQATVLIGILDDYSKNRDTENKETYLNIVNTYVTKLLEHRQ